MTTVYICIAILTVLGVLAIWTGVKKCIFIKNENAEFAEFGVNTTGKVIKVQSVGTIRFPRCKLTVVYTLKSGRDFTSNIEFGGDINQEQFSIDSEYPMVYSSKNIEKVCIDRKLLKQTGFRYNNGIQSIFLGLVALGFVIFMLVLKLKR